MIRFIVMAGPDPAIHVFAPNRNARRGRVDARIKSGQDDLLVPCTI